MADDQVPTVTQIESSTGPTIQDEYYKYETVFQQASNCSNNTRALLHFLEQDNLPIYYQFKTFMALCSAALDEENGENIGTVERYRRNAEVMLAESKKVYVLDPIDIELLNNTEKMYKEMFEVVRDYERAWDFLDSYVA